MKTTDFLIARETDVESLISDVNNEFNKISAEALNHKPTPTAWSILECIEHLNRYNAYYISALEKAVNNAPNAGATEVTSTWIGKKSIQMMSPSNQKKQKTFKKMDPTNSKLSGDVITHFLNDQRKLLQLINATRQVDANAKSVPVEFFKLLKMTIAETIHFIVVHEQRHILQAKHNLLKQGQPTP